MGKGISAVPVVAGGIVGLLFFSLASIWLGHPVIPSMDEVEAKVVYPAPEALPPVPSADEETGEQVYNRVCAACHQATGLGLPPTFPPLAASSWVNGDVETPIRIVLLGLGGPIQVEGTTYNSVMPSQGALSDAQIAKALTYVRSSFGNSAGEVSEAQVSAVREALGGRTEAWTAEELTAIRGEGADAPPPATDEGETAAADDEVVDEGDGTSEPKVEMDPAALAEAKQTFETTCGPCHGAAGDGTGPAAVALNPKPANFGDPSFWETRDRAHIIKVITEGGPSVGKSPLMAPFGGQFSEAQIAGLADYVMGFAP